MPRELFQDKLQDSIDRKNSCLVVGIDPDLNQLPSTYSADWPSIPVESYSEVASQLIFAFGRQIVDIVADLVPAVKLQSAFYERFGSQGVAALAGTADYARQCGLLVILDAKRNDIQSTASAYAEAYLGSTELPRTQLRVEGFKFDALTVNPYLGSDGVLPFVETATTNGGGVFVLVKTSNPSAVEFQDLSVVSNGRAQKLWEVVAQSVDRWGQTSIGAGGYSAVGAVVGATFPADAQRFRRLMPKGYFLVPGVGAQGGQPQDLKGFFDDKGGGVLVAASRSVIYAHHKVKDVSFADAVRQATMDLVGGLRSIRK